eukprot:COSAG05_NODE_35_length_27765_cov_221.324719_18_plen_40_part_00
MKRTVFLLVMTLCVFPRLAGGWLVGWRLVSFGFSLGKVS